MPFFTHPTSFRVADDSFRRLEFYESSAVQSPISTWWESASVVKPLPHSSHPPLGHLILLVFEAVLEVVCVSLPGYIIARQGMFDSESQKFVANLNVALFTPCLIFTKLASKLNASKLAELGVIPVIFVVQTVVSYLCSIGISRLFRFSKRPRNFVIAMGVFGNSNSLPISLVLALSRTISGLHWDKIDGDNDEEVGARGILYLLIFQQLGQLVRWSWGYHVLLAPPEKFEDTDQLSNSASERGYGGYRDDPDSGLEGDDAREGVVAERGNASSTQETSKSPQENGNGDLAAVKGPNGVPVRQFSGSVDSEQTATKGHQRALSIDSISSADQQERGDGASQDLLVPPVNGNVLSRPSSNDHIISFPHIRSTAASYDHGASDGSNGWLTRVQGFLQEGRSTASSKGSHLLTRMFQQMPRSLQNAFTKTQKGLHHFLRGLWSFMNPPLWAMLAAIIVASIPSLQRLFFTPGTFVQNSVSSAIQQSGGVAVPLILVVLGANLARNTIPNDPHRTIESEKLDTRLLIAALVSRMLLPIVIMAPLLALAAKYVPVSILDDPIFVIVCFLLTGAPSALQLAQICQINGVYEGVMSKLLFQSYVIWILPSTLVLVMCALEVVEWADE
ncbi:MAG: hypothetical protein M1833_006996 [Piccolia ochrophora]|nr:MAG: hypothetical protein M1833_006996 [Piccolia ochrophora]